MNNPTEDEIKSIVKNYVHQEILPEVGIDEINDSLSLISEGAMDSISTIKLSCFLEDKFNIKFEAHELSADSFDRLPLIAQLVKSKLI